MLSGNILYFACCFAALLTLPWAVLCGVDTCHFSGHHCKVPAKQLRPGVLQVPLPEDPPWWELFKVKRADMYAVAREVHALYQLPKMTYVSVYRAQQGSPKDAPAAKEGTPMVSAQLR